MPKDSSFYEEIVITVRRVYKTGRLESEARLSGIMIDDQVLDDGAGLLVQTVSRHRAKVAAEHERVFS